jgi:hypothetical protein
MSELRFDSDAFTSGEQGIDAASSLVASFQSTLSDLQDRTRRAAGTGSDGQTFMESVEPTIDATQQGVQSIRDGLTAARQNLEQTSRVLEGANDVNNYSVPRHDSPAASRGMLRDVSAGGALRDSQAPELYQQQEDQPAGTSAAGSVLASPLIADRSVAGSVTPDTVPADTVPADTGPADTGPADSAPLVPLDRAVPASFVPESPQIMDRSVAGSALASPLVADRSVAGSVTPDSVPADTVPADSAPAVPLEKAVPTASVLASPLIVDRAVMDENARRKA